MKASCAHVALASVLTACTGGVALAFLPPAVRVPHGGSQARHALGSTSQGSATRAAFKGCVARGGIAPREGVRLAAREDCKSCMEKDLLEAEAAAGRGVKEDDREGRRALFEEVRCKVLLARRVTQNPAGAFEAAAAAAAAFASIKFMLAWWQTPCGALCVFHCEESRVGLGSAIARISSYV